MKNIDKKELKIVSMEFRTIANRLINCNTHTGMDLLRKFLSYIDGNELISVYVHGFVDPGDFSPVEKGTCFTSMGEDKREEISYTYQYLKYSASEYHDFYRDIAWSYAREANDAVKEFCNRIILPFINYIEGYLTEIGIKMGYDESIKYTVIVNGGSAQVNGGCGQKPGLKRQEDVRMYSREKRKKAIELYIKYDKCAADVNHELGYPDRKTLTRWYKNYIRTGMYWEGYTRRQRSKYSLGQKETAVEYYLEHGRNLSRTVRALGYPSRETLRSWCDELAPGRRKMRIGGAQLTLEQKQEAVFALCTRAGSAENVAKQYGVTREALYNWKSKLLREEETAVKPRKNGKQYPEDKNALLSEIEKLKGQIKRLQLEKDILEGTVDIIKKDPGADPKDLTNREKTILVGALKDRHPLKELLACIRLARSSYFYHSKSISLPDRYEWLRQRLTVLFRENKGRYGYRRLHALLAKEGTHISEKVVRHLMKECGLAVLIKRRRYSSYRGENTPAADNIIERDFHADAPNTKWLTDITEFAIPAGKVYLSPIVDCFDGLAVSWSIGTSPDAELVNSMLDQATATLKDGEHPVVHTDRGCHYRWPGWISRTTEAGLQRSMSKKGCSPDNAACEGFFGRVKNEMFYNQSWTGVSIEKFIDVLDEYLSWYNEKRIKLSLGAMSPLEFRRSLGLVA